MEANVAWFTGLSGAGKSTIAELVRVACEKAGRSVLVLDGDEVRKQLHSDLGFSPEDIHENNARIAELALESLKHRDVVLVPIISPFRADRDRARRLIGSAFLEIYVRASLDTAIARDPKGLYRRAFNGELPGFIGIGEQVPYEEPPNPDLTLDTEQLAPDACARLLTDCLLSPDDSDGVTSS